MSVPVVDPGLWPDDVAAATLACLPDMGPARLRRVFERWPDPAGALAAVRRGDGARVFADGDRPASEQQRAALARRWAAAARDLVLEPVLRRRATRVFLADTPEYPIRDEDLPDLPPVLLGEGDAPEVVDRPRVAIVGTRSASVHGLEDAHDLGAHLARAGITVVSGLAIGIDAAAHDGAIGAGGGAVGVVATGLDVVYPRRHIALFDRVRRAGLLLTESGFGVAAERWRFPVRNRIIAALADVVVVIEATLKGGARITADRALEYDRPVLVMPGSRRNPAAAGCNALLADGAQPLLDPDDVLLALGLTAGSRRGWGAPAARPTPTGDAACVLRACGGEPASVDQLASRTGLGLDAVARALRDLERQRWIESKRGWWWPR